MHTNARRSTTARAFTLIEMLVVIVVLGIAGALVIPAMDGTNVLRVQAAVRTVISDITFAQSDAVAFQERRALLFDVDSSSYRVIAVPGSTLDPVNNTLYNPDGPGDLFIVDFSDQRYADAAITDVEFENDTSTNLIFDALGGPVATAGGNTPSTGGFIEITGSGSVFNINVEPFTGRVTAVQISGP